MHRTRVLLVALLATASLGAAPATLPAYPAHQDPSYYLDASGQRRHIRTAADWQRRRVHILMALEHVMGPVPEAARKPVPLAVRVEETIEAGGVKRTKITYQADPATRLAAYLFIPSLKAGERAPAVLCLHPTSAHGKSIISDPVLEGSTPYALELAQRGYVTLAPDYPSFGDYKSWDFDPAKHGWLSGSRKAVHDNSRSIDLLQSLPEVDPDRVAAIGHSLGGHNAIFTAVFDERIKAVVTSCAFTRFHRYYNGNVKGWTGPRYMPRITSLYSNNPDLIPFDFPELIATLAPRPMLAVAPLKDENFDVSGVRDCIAAANAIYALHGKPEHLRALYPDLAHAFPPDMREEAYRFLDGHLNGAAANKLRQ